MVIFVLVFICDSLPFRWPLSVFLMVWMLRNIYIDLRHRHLKRSRVVLLLFLILVITLIGMVLHFYYNT